MNPREAKEGRDVDVQDYVDAGLVHEIHTSERRSFRACRRRWDWLFRENYYPKVTAKPLEFGIAYHKAMETYYDPKTWDMDRDVVAQTAIVDFVQTCEEQKEKAVQELGHLYLEGEQEEDYAERVELGKGMLNYYFTSIAPKIDIGWKPIEVEVKFMVVIPNPETGEEAIWCKCKTCIEKYQNKDGWAHEWEGLPVVYAGRLDVLAQDDNGHLWVVDWKTARNISNNYEFLYLDDQVGSYVWALNVLGLDVKGFVYHEQRKGFPQAPTRNKTQRLGRWFSVNKNQDVDYDTYLQTVQTEDKEAYEAGLYEEMLQYLKNEGITYFARHQIIKPRQELDEIERNIGYEALDMTDPHLRIYPSAGRFGCSFCAFQQPCMEKNTQGDYQYALDTMFEVREPYYVRQEKGASTESKGGE